MTKVRHVLGISGGKDSTALAIYLRDHYPELELEYYFCDTGKELAETYQLIADLEAYLGKPIVRLNAAPGSVEDPFDHFLTMYGGYLPSPGTRWCTRKLKLEPFEAWIGDDPVVSYVAIRGDEHREAYISRKPNIQSIFPFRKNMWSEDVVARVLRNDIIEKVAALYQATAHKDKWLQIGEVVNRPISPRWDRVAKLNALLDVDTPLFNRVVFEFLQETDYTLSHVRDFPLLPNQDNLIKSDIFRLLEDSGVGLPKYYNECEFELDGKKGTYHRTRSGCYFCFFQQKIEWVWLYEQHPELFEKAMEYEKDGFSWYQEERLEDLIKPDRLQQVKQEHLARLSRRSQVRSNLLLEILEDDDEEVGCAACFI